MIQLVANEFVQWKKKSTTDKYGDDSFSDAVNIPCRWEDRITEVIQPDGNKITSKARVFTMAGIKLGDILVRDSEYTVIDVGTIRDLNGLFCHKEVYVV